MRGMMTEHGVSADDYLAYVHQIDHSPLDPNPAMGAAIERLPGRKLILTNGSTAHAGKVLERLGFGHHFEAVFDIIAARWSQSRRRGLIVASRRHDVDAAKSAMFGIWRANSSLPINLQMTQCWWCRTGRAKSCQRKYRRPTAHRTSTM